MKPNRLVVLLAALLVFSGIARAQNPAANSAVPKRTSIIFIQCHGLGYGDLSCYGQTNYQTPNLDRLAAEGIRFTSYYAGGAELSPAQAAWLTGRDSVHLRQRADVEVPLAAAEFNLVQRLRLAGYHTGLIGEWTLGQPWNQGFDEFAGFLNGDEGRNYYPDYLSRFDPKNSYDPMTRQWGEWNPEKGLPNGGPEMIYANTGGKKGQYLPDLFSKAMLNFIRINQPDEVNQFRPFFLLVNLPAPRPATVGKDDFPVPSDAPFSGENWPPAAKNRAALITRLDSSIGQLLEKLKQPGFSNNVAVFFTSDAGPEKFADPKLNFLQPAGALRGQRGGLYEGGLRVPLLVRWPEQIAAGSVANLPVAAWDLAPTILEMALVPAVTNFDGVSILPTLAGKPAAQPREIFFRWEQRGRETAQAARLGDWKALRLKVGEKWELYQLKTDPGETQNVAEKNPGVIKSIEEAWKNCDDPKVGRPVWPAQVSTNRASKL